MSLLATYAFLALIATLANIGTQELAMRLYQGELALWLSLIAGTGVGLVVKYVLDKRYIFHFQAENTVHDGQVFILYSVMGLLTTGIFWGFELLFHYLFESREMRYLGGCIGLAIGYLSKYQLDKRYVFKTIGT